ncbi:glycoside hydrolase superfamily [Hypomontagnella monticulosa]|nr:glycoside hydrolase superfamily [Hypomontagnella monticulosa]
MAIRSLALTALAGAASVAAQDTIDVPTDLSTRALVPDVYGYSIEPIWLNDYLSTPLAKTLLSSIADITGAPPPIRVGGNTADQTYLHPTLPGGNISDPIPGLPNAKLFNVTPSWYDTWADYFPAGTPLIYTLNLAANESAWSNAVAQAEAAYAALGDKLVMFELGNEIDHFINKGWRSASWGVDEYIGQFRNLTGQIRAAEWYKNAESKPRFQAGVFADPPWVPDQQDEIDDFSIANLTREGEGGIVERDEDREIIGSYATHLYPQSSCDAKRWLRMRLDLLSNHTTLWLNVSQYIPQVAAADKAGAPLVMGETNSVSCGGKSGISDTFGAALWGIDYVLMGASVGIQKTYFHLGAQSEYSSFTPKPYTLKNESLASGIRPGWYGHYFVAKVAAAGKGENLSIAALPGANSSDLSGYAVYTGEEQQRALRKLVFLDMGVWNGTEGLSNNSTLNATDGTVFSNGTRPTTTLSVKTPWCNGANVSALRLTAPGTNAKSGVAVAGVTFNSATGEKVGEEKTETLSVGENGVVEVKLTRAEGVLLEVEDGSNCSSGPVAETSGALKRGPITWVGALAAGVGAVFMIAV